MAVWTGLGSSERAVLNFPVKRTTVGRHHVEAELTSLKPMMFILWGQCFKEKHREIFAVMFSTKMAWKLPCTFVENYLSIWYILPSPTPLWFYFLWFIISGAQCLEIAEMLLFGFSNTFEKVNKKLYLPDKIRKRIAKSPIFCCESWNSLPG